MDLPSAEISAAFALRLGVVAATLLARGRHETARRIGLGGAIVASLISAAAALEVIRSGIPVRGLLFYHGASGLALSYAIDGLSAWFLIVLALIAVPVAVFSLGYLRHGVLDQRSAFFGAALNILLGAVELVFVAGDTIAFLFGWELMTLATAALVATEHEDRVTRRAAFLYLVMSHVGTGALIAAFFILGAAAGSDTFSILLRGDVVSGLTRHAVFFLFFFGFAIKAGVIPLHIWLPEAHPAAPTGISALMSGVLIKTGIYGMVRFAMFGLGTPALSWGVIVLMLGALSAVVGVLYALVQHDIKRLLAYHSIENIGIILIGLGAGMIALAGGHPVLAAVGVASGLFHVMNHALFKALLFLGAGSVVTATGTRQIEELGGLLRRMPWTGATFLIGAIAISGIPPLNGFASEWLAFQALLFGFGASADPLVQFLFPVVGALLALTGALAAACFVKAFGISFLALPRSAAAAAARESSALIVAPQVFLAIVCVALGLLPGVAMTTLHRVMAALPGVQPDARLLSDPLHLTATAVSSATVAPALLASVLMAGIALAAVLEAVRRARRVPRTVPTWGCGGVLTAKTEYTATAFSKPLMMVFRAVYRPTRDVEAIARVSPYFPHEVRYRVEIEATFERFLYTPLTSAVLKAADRLKIVQAGSLHAYLGYVIALVLTLVLLVWWRS